MMCHMDGIDGGIDDLRLNVLYSRGLVRTRYTACTAVLQLVIDHMVPMFGKEKRDIFFPRT